MNKQIIVLAGDGIGPEVTQQAIKVMEAVNYSFGHEFQFKNELIGACSIDETGSPLTNEVVEACATADAVLLGAIGDPKYDNNPHLKVRPEQGLLKLRKALGLFSNIRPITTFSMSSATSPLKEEVIKGVDLLIYRELTGGLYFGEKQRSEDQKTASEVCEYTAEEIQRIAKLAFEAADRRRKKLTLVDKANVLETSRLWREVIQEMAKDFPEVTVEYLFVDNAAMQLMINPRQFDVILTENLFGDILSDQASVITGSLGMIPSSSIGTNSALFEPIHGSFPEAAGKDIANPMATILSVAMMYDHFGLSEEAEMIRSAVYWAIKEGFLTRDLKAEDYLSCSKVGDLIAMHIEERGEVHVSGNGRLYSDLII